MNKYELLRELQDLGDSARNALAAVENKDWRGAESNLRLTIYLADECVGMMADDAEEQIAYLAKELGWEPGHITDRRIGDQHRPVDWAITLLKREAARAEAAEAKAEKLGEAVSDAREWRRRAHTAESRATDLRLERDAALAALREALKSREAAGDDD